MSIRRLSHTLFLLTLLVGELGIGTLDCVAAEWPQWRGPDGQGHATATNLPVTWSETENVTWRTELPGKGWSSPVIEGRQIWLTTAIESPLSEEEKKAKLKDDPNAKSLSVSGKLSMRALCVDRLTGKLLHDLELMVEQNPAPVHTLNSYASPSPIIEDGDANEFKVRQELFSSFKSCSGW